MFATLQSYNGYDSSQLGDQDKPTSEDARTDLRNCSSRMFFGRNVKIVYLLVRTLFLPYRAIGSPLTTSCNGSGYVRATRIEEGQLSLTPAPPFDRGKLTQLT